MHRLIFYVEKRLFLSDDFYKMVHPIYSKHCLALLGKKIRFYDGIETSMHRLIFYVEKRLFLSDDFYKMVHPMSR